MIGFRETFLTLVSSKSRKCHDIGMKLYQRINNKEQKCVRDFGKTVFIVKLWILLKKHSPGHWGKNLLLCKKPKRKLLRESRASFLDIEINFSNTKFWANLIWFRRAGVPESLENIAKLDTISEQFAWQIFNSFLCKLISDYIRCMNF